MSIEYIINVKNRLDEAFDAVVAVLGANLPNTRPAHDNNGIWIPSSDPKWIDFSIEKSTDGFFIMSNLDKTTKDIVFSLIESTLSDMKVDFSIEEI